MPLFAGLSGELDLIVALLQADHGALDAIKAAEQVAAAVAANSSATYADIQTADKVLQGYGFPLFAACSG